MEYVKVDSSQIAEVGYGEGLYGPETLGIKFPPNKKQRETGELGSEYHYGGFAPEKHQEFMVAESIGSYFGRNIKSNPDLYPFTKVEADPTHPAGASVTKETSGTLPKKNSAQPSADLDGDAANGTGSTDTPSSGSALAVLDTLAPETIFSPGKVDLIIAQLHDQVLAMAKGLDPSTPAKQKRIRDIKGLVASQRIFIEKARKGYVSDLVAKKTLTDKVSNMVQGALSAIENEILEVTGYSAWEQGEKDRKAQNERTLLGINAMQPHVYPTIDSLILAIAQLNSIDTSTMQEFKDLATGAKERQLKELTTDLVKRQTAEAEREELEALRAEKAKQDDDARIAAAAQELADKQTQERLDAAVEAAKIETRQEVIAELAVPVEESDEEFEQSGQYRSHSSAPAPQVAQGGIVENREQAYNREAVEALMGCALTRHEAMAVLTAIFEGRIPHVSITY